MATLVTIRSIWATHTKAEVVVLLPVPPTAVGAGSTPAPDADVDMLRNFRGPRGESVRLGFVRSFSKNLPEEPQFVPRVASIYRNKLWAFSLVQYASVIFIDSDVLLRRNLDHLFLTDRFTVARDNISPLNAALWVANPSCQALEDLRDIAWDTGFNTATGWNRYGPFPHYNAALRARGELADWDFYGSSVDQGLLYYYFNMVLRDVEWLNATTLNDEWVHHFVGLAKPWLHLQSQPDDGDADVGSDNSSTMTAAVAADGHAQVTATKQRKKKSKQSADRGGARHRPKLAAAAELWHALAQSVAEDPSLDPDWLQRYNAATGDRSLRDQYVRRFYRNVRF